MKYRVGKVTFNEEDRKNYLLGFKQRKDERRALTKVLTNRKSRRVQLDRNKKAKQLSLEQLPETLLYSSASLNQENNEEPLDINIDYGNENYLTSVKVQALHLDNEFDNGDNHDENRLETKDTRPNLTERDIVGRLVKKELVKMQNLQGQAAKKHGRKVSGKRLRKHNKQLKSQQMKR